MARWGKVNFRELKALQKRMEKLQKADLDAFSERVAKELAARLLAKVIKRTPVGQYTDGKVGGTLRRGWTADSNREAELASTFGGGTGAKRYAESLEVVKKGNTFIVEIINPVEYASYVEYGHRTRGGKGWVSGNFMLTISENELDAQAPKIIEKRLNKILGEMLDG